MTILHASVKIWTMVKNLNQNQSGEHLILSLIPSLPRPGPADLILSLIPNLPRPGPADCQIPWEPHWEQDIWE